MATSRRPDQEYFVNGQKRHGPRTLLRLLADGYKERCCEWCKNEKWNGSPIPLEVDHIDGNHVNNELSNLRILCPNCHAQTETYKGKNICQEKRKTLASHICQSCFVAKVSRVNLRCKKCAANARNQEKIFWPSEQDLISLVNKTNFSQAGRILGVTDNAIRKRLKKKGLL